MKYKTIIFIVITAILCCLTCLIGLMKYDEIIQYGIILAIIIMMFIFVLEIKKLKQMKTRKILITQYVLLFTIFALISLYFALMLNQIFGLPNGGIGLAAILGLMFYVVNILLSLCAIILKISIVIVEKRLYLYPSVARKKEE